MKIKNGQIIIYDVDNKYRDYLHSYDIKVNLKEGRRFCGILVENRGINYCIPLSSRPYRANGKRRNSKTTVEIKAQNGKLIGALLINNMIPINSEVIKQVDINIDLDKDYLKNEIRYLNKDIVLKEIEKKSSKTLNIYSKQKFIKSLYCNFKMLENKCTEWQHKQHLDEKKFKQNEMMTTYEKTSIKDLTQRAVKKVNANKATPQRSKDKGISR